MPKNKNKINMFRNNYKFLDSSILNDATFIDYLDRFRKVALSVFEWVNLPKSMNAIYLEKCLYYNGQASLLKDKNYGFINTKCCSNGKINIYGYPTSLNCYSYEYQTSRKLYTGIENNITEEERENKEYNECILVQNNWERTPTGGSMELFAYRLYEAEQTAFVNIRAQKTPVLLLVDEHSRSTVENMFSQIDGNRPVIYGNKDNIDPNNYKALKIDAPFIADKIMDYKKEIWNEALTFLRD